jgi:hypothetical protein
MAAASEHFWEDPFRKNCRTSFRASFRANFRESAAENFQVS